MMKRSKQGFTLVEVAASVTLVVIVLGLAVAGYMFSLKNINQGDVQNELDMDVQLAMERLKVDLRLSSLDAMFYYPAGPGPYEAISFPMAYDNDGDGVLEKDAEGKLIWDRTVIYHIRPTTPNQLVKTTFEPRDESLTDAQRQAQLESVVYHGDGSGTFNGNKASSDVIFENLLEWEIRPEEGRYDGYSPTVQRDSASMGYVLLSPGPHKFTFNVVGKNNSSSGYRIGIDQLFVSPSYSPREAESQLPVIHQSGAAAVSRYMDGDWKGNHQLDFPATGIGDNFTLVLGNDRWEETNFGATGYEAVDTEAVFDQTLTPWDFVAKLKGNDVAWTAEDQTFTTGYGVNDLSLLGAQIAVHINGDQLRTNGNWIVHNGAKSKLTFQASSGGNLQVENVRIAQTDRFEQISTNAMLFFTPVLFGGSTQSPVTSTGGSTTSDWVDVPINTTNNYLVVFDIVNNTGQCKPYAWTNLRSPATPPLYPEGECWVNGMRTNVLFGLSSITASYPASGTYTSQIFDTHLPSPKYQDLAWDAVIPANTTLLMKVRSGNNPDLSDAADWSLIIPSAVNPRSVGAGYKRFVQFQALFTTDPNNPTVTPKLKDVTINWTGERQLVNIGGIVTKGPDYGIFELYVDGSPLRSALIVDLEIYKDVLVMNKEMRRITSSLQADLTPRNSGM